MPFRATVKRVVPCGFDATHLEIMRRLVVAFIAAALPACASAKDTTVFYNVFYDVFYHVIIPLCCVSS